MISGPPRKAPRKKDGSVNMAGAGRYYMSYYLGEFFDAESQTIEASGANTNPLKLYVLYEGFIRAKVLEANPALRKESFDGRGELVEEARVGAIVRRILPEFSQFIAVWLDRFDMPFDVAPLQTPYVGRTTRGIVKGDSGGVP